MRRPIAGMSSNTVPGRSSGGTRNERPSSPPVYSESWLARIAKADATASVIMAKKIARTRSDRRPITNASTAPATSAIPRPSPADVHVGSQP